MNEIRISAIIPCHNYGKFLGNCIQSLLGQTRAPDEIIVVDDASDQNDVQPVIERFNDPRISLYHVTYRNPLLTRRAGFERSTGNILAFIDADDAISSFYFEEGLKYFEHDPRIAIVYSDVEFFGDRTGIFEYPMCTDSYDLSVSNFIHAGALVRRDALEVADAFNHGGPQDRHEDWSTWRKIIDQGFKAVKQKELYFYRKHPQGISSTRVYDEGEYCYYRGAALSEEHITLFTPLAGRTELWKPYSQFLEQQTWDHNKIKLIFMDTSQNAEFGQMIQSWLANSDYSDYHYIARGVGVQGIADEKRTDDEGRGRDDVLKGVRIAMARIYNSLRDLITTNYTWIVEDDIIPPLDACERLLRSFCPGTVSVSGAFDHRYEDAVVAWDETNVCLKGGEGVQIIKGNGFGCVMLRSSLIKKSVFSHIEHNPDYDKAFYDALEPNYDPINPKDLVKLDWSIYCEHLSPNYLKGSPLASRNGKTNIIVLEDRFDELTYLQENPDVHCAILTGVYESGLEHFLAYGESQGRPAHLLEE